MFIPTSEMLSNTGWTFNAEVGYFVIFSDNSLELIFSYKKKNENLSNIFYNLTFLLLT